MAAAKKKAGGFRKRFFQVVPRVFGGLSPRLALAVLLATLVLGGVLFAWLRWGTAVTRHPRYVLAPDNIQIPPQPEWIRSDVKAEVFRDGSLGQLSSLDPQITVKVARAFTGHTWVAQVKRVAKQYPATMLIELDYRRPVGMVVVTDANGQPGVIPVDANGVVLPPAEFLPQDGQNDAPAKNYLRIVVGETVPLGVEGTAWGDERVHGAAKIAGLLADHWAAFGLYRVGVIETEIPAKKKADIVYELSTREGTQVLWGHAPGSERSSEASAGEKVARLAIHVERFGTLANKNSPAEIDLRDKSGAKFSPRTARRK